jgi:hypothetical protein
MRTKTLLIAAAALAAMVISSEAQTPVYSANVVGYATVVFKGQGKYTLVANPFDDGNGNQLTNLLAALPGGSQVLTWNGATFVNFNNVAGVWQNNTNLPPGVGFFVKNGKVTGGTFPDITNMFAGTVILPNNSSTTNAVPVGYTLWGSVVPYAGDLADSGVSTGDTNLNVGTILPAGSQVLTWNVAAQTYSQSTKAGGVWNSTVTANVGDGFFMRNKNGPATNWVQTLNLQ